MTGTPDDTTGASQPEIHGRPLLDEPVSIAIVDYGMGNRRSVEKALQRIGAEVNLTDQHDQLRAADGLVLPGVGAFPRGMQNLRSLGLDTLLREQLAQGKPLLGICLGMQLAFERSTELGGAEGLGAIPGEVRELSRSVPSQSAQLKLPHIGWNEVGLTRDSPLTDGLPRRCAFYHVHSFAPVPAEDEDILGVSTYAGEFASIVAHGNFYGAQFHPEKSSAAGLRLLANFARICTAASRRAAAGAVTGS